METITRTMKAIKNYSNVVSKLFVLTTVANRLKTELEELEQHDITNLESYEEHGRLLKKVAETLNYIYYQNDYQANFMQVYEEDIKKIANKIVKENARD